MANSLRNKIKHFCYKGELSESERNRLLNALDDTELKQQPILDKIRAEIIELRSKQNVGVLECLDIIDKYKAESEGKEL